MTQLNPEDTFFLRVVSLFLGFLLLIALILETTNGETEVVLEYEDGSGVLSDGRSFCINNEPCEER